MDAFKDLVFDQLKALRPAFISKKPHFNFISAHCESSWTGGYGNATPC
jgi:hypothetical protein